MFQGEFYGGSQGKFQREFHGEFQGEFQVVFHGQFKGECVMWCGVVWCGYELVSKVMYV